MKLFINIFMQKKSLEDTIRKLHQKYKNVPSPLSENYSRLHSNIGVTPQQTTPGNNFRDSLVGDFKPQRQRFFG